MKSEIVKLILNKSSLTSWYFMLHYRLHTVIGAGLLAYFAYFYTFNVDFVCYCEPDMKIVFETHCWNQMDEVQWQKLIPFVGGQLMVLLVPFLIWKMKDGNRLSVVASSDSMDEIVDFFVSTRRKNKMYVLTIQKNFCFIKHMLKMSGFPNKSVFMFRIKGGMKKGEGLQSQNCFESG